MGLTTPTSNSAWRGGMTIRAAGPEKACKATMLHLRRTTVSTKRAGLDRFRDAPSRRRCRQHALCLREPRLFVALHAAQAAAAVGSRDNTAAAARAARRPLPSLYDAHVAVNVLGAREYIGIAIPSNVGVLRG